MPTCRVVGSAQSVRVQHTPPLRVLDARDPRASPALPPYLTFSCLRSPAHSPRLLYPALSSPARIAQLDSLSPHSRHGIASEPLRVGPACGPLCAPQAPHPPRTRAPPEVTQHPTRTHTTGGDAAGSCSTAAAEPLRAETQQKHLPVASLRALPRVLCAHGTTQRPHESAARRDIGPGAMCVLADSPSGPCAGRIVPHR